MWLLVLVTFVALDKPLEYTVVRPMESGVKCRSLAVSLNGTRPRADVPPSDPNKRFACFALDSAT